MAIKTPNVKNKKLGDAVRLTLFWAIVIFCILLGVAFMSPQDKLKEVPISGVIQRANDGKITKIEVQGDDIKVTPKGEKSPTEKSTKQSGSSIQEQGLKVDAPVELSIIPPSTTDETLWNLAIIIVPVILIAGFFMFMMRQAQGQNNHCLLYTSDAADE